MTSPAVPTVVDAAPAGGGGRPILGVIRRTTAGRRVRLERGLLTAVCVAPVLAIAGGVVWAALVGGASTGDLVTAGLLYLVSVAGVTVGYHRLLTHGSFKTHPWLRVLLAIMGTLALENGPVTWVADHRRHHKYSDRDGDPHSPHRFGTGPKAMLKGLAYAHLGWLFADETTDAARYAPDLLADRGVAWVERHWRLFAVLGLVAPSAAAYVLEGPGGALNIFLWAGVVRVGLAHHVTFSINSLCHTFGKRPFRSTDRSTNLWWLAVLSLGESWHNLHHADPTSARHGVLRGQFDASAGLIRLLERSKLAWDVRWPTSARLSARLA